MTLSSAYSLWCGFYVFRFSFGQGDADLFGLRGACFTGSYLVLAFPIFTSISPLSFTVTATLSEGTPLQVSAVEDYSRNPNFRNWLHARRTFIFVSAKVDIRLAGIPLATIIWDKGSRRDCLVVMNLSY